MKRFKIDNVIDVGNEESKLFMHEAIDELYLESRKAVDEEIDQVEDLIMENAVKQGKDADEIEITNLLHDLAIWEKKQKQM